MYIIYVTCFPGFTATMVSLSAKNFHWQEVDNVMLVEHFQSFFSGQRAEHGTKGNLPSKNNHAGKIHTYLE